MSNDKKTAGGETWPAKAAVVSLALAPVISLFFASSPGGALGMLTLIAWHQVAIARHTRRTRR